MGSGKGKGGGRSDELKKGDLDYDDREIWCNSRGECSFVDVAKALLLHYSTTQKQALSHIMASWQRPSSRTEEMSVTQVVVSASSLLARD